MTVTPPPANEHCILKFPKVATMGCDFYNCRIHRHASGQAGQNIHPQIGSMKRTLFKIFWVIVDAILPILPDQSFYVQRIKLKN